MTQDWAAVGEAIERNMTKLGINQEQLAERSSVALSIVRELRHNTVHRRRQARTLEAISIGLGLHPRHLTAVAAGDPPPTFRPPTQPKIRDQLATIENRVDKLAAQIAAIDERLTTVTGRPVFRPPNPEL